jgi:hypothetical protein
VVSGHANLGTGGGEDFLQGEYFKPKEPSAPLPSIAPDEVDPTFKLSIQDDTLRLTSDRFFQTSRPDLRILARWWVNDKPFVPRDGEAAEFMGDIVGSPCKELRLKLNLPPAKIGAQPGDRISLQLLYCDHWCYVRIPSKTWGGGSGEARLSNKIEFLAK